jgi:hypothetical protein
MAVSDSQARRRSAARRITAAAASASPRHRNCFYYFRGPAARSVEGREIEHQVEDNTTKALINVIEHSDRSVLTSFLDESASV